MPLQAPAMVAYEMADPISENQYPVPEVFLGILNTGYIYHHIGCSNNNEVRQSCKTEFEFHTKAFSRVARGVFINP